MSKTFERLRDEPVPDLWPEIERRLQQSLTSKQPRRGRKAVSAAFSAVLIAGALAWALSSLRLGSAPSIVPFSQGEVARIPAGRFPQPIAADDAAAWVVSGSTESGDVLWRIDAATDHATELPATRGAAWPAVGEGFAWVTCTGSRNPCGGNSVLKLDRQTGATLATISLPGTAIAIATGLGNVWVSTSAGLVKIDPLAARVLATFPVRTNLLGTANGSVWTARFGRASGTVVRIDPLDGHIEETVEFFDPCMFLATNDGVWVESCRGGLPPGSPGDVLERIDPATGRVSYRIPVEQFGGSLILAGARLWLARWAGQHVEIEARDPVTGEPTGTVLRVKPGPRAFGSVGMGPPAVFIAQGGGSFWLTHVDSNDVVRLGAPSSGS